MNTYQNVTCEWTSNDGAKSRAQTARWTTGEHVRGVLATFKKWYLLRKQRLALDKLDDRLLRDIGITRYQAEAEVNKPFWHV